MKKVLLGLFLISSMTVFAQNEVQIISYGSKKSCEDAKTIAKQSVEDRFKLKSLLAGRSLSIESYKGYRLGECEESQSSFFHETTYYVPLFVELKRAEALEKRNVLELKKVYLKKDSGDFQAFHNKLEADVEAGVLLDEVCEKYPQLDESEIDYITYKRGTFNRKINGSHSTIVVILK